MFNSKIVTEKTISFKNFVVFFTSDYYFPNDAIIIIFVNLSSSTIWTPFVIKGKTTLF